MAAVRRRANLTDAEKVVILREHLQMALDWWELKPREWNEKVGWYMSPATLCLHLQKALRATRDEKEQEHGG